MSKTVTGPPALVFRTDLEMLTPAPTQRLDNASRLLLTDKSLGEDDQYALSTIIMEEILGGIRDDDGLKTFGEAAGPAANISRVKNLLNPQVHKSTMPTEFVSYRQAPEEERTSILSGAWDTKEQERYDRELADRRETDPYFVPGAPNSIGNLPVGLDSLSKEERAEFEQEYVEELAHKDHRIMSNALASTMSEEALTYARHVVETGEHVDPYFNKIAAKSKADAQLIQAYIRTMRGPAPSDLGTNAAALARGAHVQAFDMAEGTVIAAMKFLGHTPRQDGVPRAFDLDPNIAMLEKALQVIEEERPAVELKAFTPEAETAVGRAVTGAIQSLPFTGAAVFAPPMAVLGIANGTRKRLISKGVDENVATNVAVATAIPEVMLDRFAAQFLFKKGAAGGLRAFFASTSGQAFHKRMGALVAEGIKRTAKAGTVEISTEIVQEAFNASSEALSDADKDGLFEFGPQESAQFQQFITQIPDIAAVAAVFTVAFGSGGFARTFREDGKAIAEKSRDAYISKIAASLETPSAEKGPVTPDRAAQILNVVTSFGTQEARENAAKSFGMTLEDVESLGDDLARADAEVSGQFETEVEALAKATRAQVERVESGIEAEGIAPAELEEFVDDLSEKLPGARKPRVVATQAELSEGLIKKAGGGRIEGAIEGGKTALVAENIPDTKRAREVFIHEGVIHYGLDRFEARKDAVLKKTQAELEAAGLDADGILDRLPTIRTAYEQMLAVRGEEAANLLAVEEYVAKISEKVIDGETLTVEERSIWKRFVDFMRDVLGISSIDERSERVAAKLVGDLLRLAKNDVQAAGLDGGSRLSVRKTPEAVVLSEAILNGAIVGRAEVQAAFPKMTNKKADQVAEVANKVAARLVKEYSTPIERSKLNKVLTDPTHRAEFERVASKVFEVGLARGSALESALTEVQAKRKEEERVERAAFLDSREGLTPAEIHESGALTAILRLDAKKDPKKVKEAAEEEVPTDLELEGDPSAEDVAEAKKGPKKPIKPVAIDPDVIPEIMVAIKDRIRTKQQQEGVYVSDTSPVFRADLRRTYEIIASKASRTLLHGPKRTTATKQIDALRTKKTVPSIDRHFSRILEGIVEGRVRDSKNEAFRKMKILFKHYGGRIAYTTEFEKQKIAPIAKRQINNFKWAFKLSPDAVLEEHQKLSTEKDAITKGTTEADLVNEKLVALETFGGLRSPQATSADAWGALESVQQLVDGGLKEVAEAQEKSLQESLPLRQTLITSAKEKLRIKGRVEEGGFARDFLLKHPRLENMMNIMFDSAGAEEARAAEKEMEPFYQEMNLAHLVSITRKKRRFDDLVVALTRIYDVGPNKIDARIRELERPRDEYRKFSADGDRALSTMNLLGIYATMKQEWYNSLATTQEGQKGPHNEALAKRLEMIPEIREELGDSEIELMNYLIDEYAKERDELSAMMRRVTGIEMADPGPRYMPAFMKPLPKTGTRSLGIPVIPDVFTPRVRHKKDLDETMSPLQVFNRRVSSNSHLLEFIDWNRTVRNVFLDGDVQDAITKANGERYLNHMLAHLTDVATDGASSNVDGPDTAINSILAFTAWRGLGLNIQSAFKGLGAGYPQWLLEIPMSRLAEYAVAGASNFETMKKMAAHPAWQERFGAGIEKALTHIDRTGGSAVQAKFSRNLLIFHAVGDAVPSLHIGSGIFAAAYNDASLPNSMSEEDRTNFAMAEAMRFIEATQMSGAQKDMSHWVRRSGALAKMAIQFQGPTIQFLGYDTEALAIVRGQVRRAKKGAGTDKQKLKRAMRILFANHVLIPAVFNGLAVIWKGIRDGELPDEDDLKLLLASMAVGPWSGAMVFGNILLGSASVFATGGSNPYAGKLPVFDLIEVVGDGYAIAGAGFDMNTEEMREALDDAARSNFAPLREIRAFQEARE